MSFYYWALFGSSRPSFGLLELLSVSVSVYPSRLPIVLLPIILTPFYPPSLPQSEPPPTISTLALSIKCPFVSLRNSSVGNGNAHRIDSFSKSEEAETENKWDFQKKEEARSRWKGSTADNFGLWHSGWTYSTFWGILASEWIDAIQIK